MNTPAVPRLDTASGRFITLDALRGLAIALMILVNTPGSWSHVYAPLLHAPWHGFTFADLVFPMFLFAVGAAMAFSMARATPTAAVFGKIAKRTLLLFGCGLFLHWFPFSQSLTELRIPGVLQRIALCYGLAALLLLYLKPRSLLVVTVLLPLLYWALLWQFSLQHPYELSGNAVQRFDVWLLGSAHLYQGFGAAFDPEGLLSTLPAVSSVLVGYLVATALRQMDKASSVLWLLGWGLALSLLGLLWHLLWPINKPLWSGSYVAFSSGLILLLLAAMVWWMDVRHRQTLQPLVVYGSNPLFIYMLSWLWASAATQLIRFSYGGQTISLYQFGFESLIALLPAKLASLTFALLHVLLFWWLSYLLYWRRIFIKL